MPTLHSSTLDSMGRQPSNLNDRLDKRLLAYMASAGAAGVGVLAMAKPANAKVVYTAANRSILSDSRLDLNNDGIPDYAFHGPFAFCGTCSYLDVLAIKFNKMMSNAQPLASGVSVGPDNKFRGDQGEMIFWCTCSGNPATDGPWLGIQNGYMGYEFNIKGRHILAGRVFRLQTKGAITLTGYAYETISLKPIVTGDTGANNDDEDSADQKEPPAAYRNLPSWASWRLAHKEGRRTKSSGKDWSQP
jgi:hypothetical protein